MFSKAMQGKTIEKLADKALEMGFDGVDLTCREEGHVEPAESASALEKTAAYLRSRGLSVPLITTNYTSAAQPYARDVFAAAASAGVKYIKLGYWRMSDYNGYYHGFNSVMSDLDGLEDLARECGVCAVLHPHDGPYLFSAAFQIRDALANRDPQSIGAYPDCGNLAAEGMSYGWILGMEMLAPYTKVVAVKNFWAQRGYPGESRWRPKLCPFDDGIVDFALLFTILRKQRFDGCVSVHGEYLGSSSFKVMNTEENLDQLDKDFRYLKETYTAALEVDS